MPQQRPNENKGIPTRTDPLKRTRASAKHRRPRPSSASEEEGCPAAVTERQSGQTTEIPEDYTSRMSDAPSPASSTYATKIAKEFLKEAFEDRNVGMIGDTTSAIPSFHTYMTDERSGLVVGIPTSSQLKLKDYTTVLTGIMGHLESLDAKVALRAQLRELREGQHCSTTLWTCFPPCSSGIHDGHPIIPSTISNWVKDDSAMIFNASIHPILDDLIVEFQAGTEVDQESFLDTIGEFAGADTDVIGTLQRLMRVSSTPDESLITVS